jgi:curved DNA-binding protein CbpA
MTKSLYSILNVAPDADPAVIEAAYKALMKKHHPDVRSDDPESSRRIAAEINEAFHILKDPAKRADYDTNERIRREALRRSSAAIAEAPRAYQPPPLPPRRRRSKWPALFMIATAALAVFFIWRGSDAAHGGETGLARLVMPQPRQAQAKLAQVSSGDVDRAVAQFTKIRDRSGLIGLAAFSHDCFAAQDRSQAEADFDFCVAFDKAALTYGLDWPGHDYLPQLPRFEPREIERRHAAAGRLLSSDKDLIQSRIAQVGILTSTRLRALNPMPHIAEEERVVVPKAASAYRAPRPAAKRYAQRYRKPRHAPQRPRQRREGDFLERQGYIY